MNILKKYNYIYKFIFFIILITIIETIINLIVPLNKEINQIIIVTGSTGTGYITWNQSEKYKEVHKYDIEFAYDYINKYADKVYITETDIGDLDKNEFLEYQKSKVKNIEAVVIPNRHLAIELAIKESKNKDVIFISGRGNRRLMCVGKKDVKIFKDKDHVNQIIEGGE